MWRLIDDWFGPMMFGLAIGGIIIIMALAPQPTDNVKLQLDACQSMWYTVEATWKGDLGRIVMECK